MVLYIVRNIKYHSFLFEPFPHKALEAFISPCLNSTMNQTGELK